MQKIEPITQDQTISDGPPMPTLVVNPKEMHGMTLTDVKQNANAMNPLNPRYSSCLYPIFDNCRLSSSVPMV
jgi:hypothetical protein